MKEWGEVRLGDVTSKIGSGATPRGGKNSYRESGIALIRSMNVYDFAFDDKNLAFIDEGQAQQLSHVAVQSGDVLVNITGASVARTCLAPPTQLPARVNQHVAIVRPNPKLAVAGFINAYLGSPIGKARLLNLASNGATREALTKQNLQDFTIPYPPVAEQQRIADLLGSIDELIENSQRRIEILEKMAQAIYREWFVYFRFPGQEETTFVDSPLGPIPEGWEIRKTSDALLINPRTKALKEVEDPFFTMGDLDERSLVCFPSEYKSGNSGSKFLNGDTLFARITPCLENGKTGFVAALEEGQVGRGSTEFIVLRGSLVGSAFTYFLARSPEFRAHAIASMSGASGRQRVRNECFDSFELAVPPPDLVEQFERLASSMINKAFSLAGQNRSLMTVRDLLLPKLVTGEIDVSSLDLDALIGAAS